MHRSIKQLLASYLLLLIAPLVILAQGSNATITGTVRDATGTVINGAEVRVESSAAGFSRNATTGTDGQYQLTDVPAGIYQISVNATGYRSATANVTITNDARQIVDLGISTTAADAQVAVTTDIEVVNREESMGGNVIDSRRVQDLLLVNRNPYNLVLTQPGAVNSFHTEVLANRTSETPAFYFNKALPFTLGGLHVSPANNGNRPSSSNFQLDGIDNNSQQVGGVNTNISNDAVQELRIATNNYSAEYGRNSGYVANIQTKSGSTEYHGSLFEFFNNDVLNANNFFAGFVQPGSQLFFEDNRDRIRRNQFGATIGGPLIPSGSGGGSNCCGSTGGGSGQGRYGLYFFASAEFHRERSSLINTVTVPTSQFINSIPVGFPQRDVLTLFPNTTPSFGFNDADFDGVAETGIGVAAITRSINRNMYSGRIDWIPNNNDRIALRYAYDGYAEDAANGQLPGAGFGLQGFGTKITNRSTNVLASWTHTFNSHAFNDFSFGYNRYAINAFQPIALDAPLALTQPGTIPPTVVPDLSLPESEDLLTGVTLPGLRTDLPLRMTESTYQFRDMISYTFGNHSIRVGGEYRRLLNPSFSNAFANGKFTFLGLVGNPNSFFIPPTPAVPQPVDPPLYTQFLFNPADGGLPDTYRTFRRNEGNFFIQYDWKASSNLTLNLGLRYEYFGVISTRDDGFGNQSSNFFPGGGDGFFANVANGGFVPSDFAGDRLYRRDNNNFAPRIGLVYDLSGSGKTVIRANYGIFYDRVYNRVLENIRFNPPFAAIGLFTGGPVNTYNTPIDRNEIFISPSTPNGFAIDPNITTPYVQQWALGVQHDLGGNTMLDVSYIGNTGRGLVVSSDVNRFNGSGLFLRPNPNVARLFLTETIAKSFYNALQVSVNRRFTNGLTFNINYVYSHAIDEVSEAFRGGIHNSMSSAFAPLTSEAFAGPLEVRNFRGDRGSADFDTRHRGMFSIVYDLPFFRDTAYGGLQLNAIVTLQSGQPLTIFSATDGNGDLIFNDRAVFLGQSRGQAYTKNDETLDYINPFLFAPSVGGFAGGPMGRNMFKGPGFSTVDFAIFKNTKLGEDTNLQFRAEFFNLFNRTNFTNPHGNLSNPATFGKVTNAYNPRMIQLALRFQF